MSRKGNDLVRHYLWNAARSAIRHNQVINALYSRLKAKGKRGDVALGQCMRKLLHLVYAVWKTNRPFDDQQGEGDTPRVAANSGAGSEAPAARSDQAPAGVLPSDTPAGSESPAPTSAAAPAGNQKAVGHKPD